MTDEIVVATDGSPESITAARWAADFAGRLAAPVVVLDVVQRPYAEMPVDDAGRVAILGHPGLEPLRKVIASVRSCSKVVC